jgi:hypothetical protein
MYHKRQGTRESWPSTKSAKTIGVIISNFSVSSDEKVIDNHFAVLYLLE